MFIFADLKFNNGFYFSLKNFYFGVLKKKIIIIISVPYSKIPYFEINFFQH